MKQAQRKDFYREIRKSLNRFLSIFFMVMLGVAFYAGVRSTEPDMRLTADSFYDETELMDIRVLGTLGLTESDVEAIADVDGVETAEGAYSTELFCEAATKDLVCSVSSLCVTQNMMSIVEGRLPENAGECFVDRQLIESGQYQLGDTIRLFSDTREDIDDILAETEGSERFVREYRIVGYGNYSYYLSWDRGSSAIGTGDVDAFVMLPKEAFLAEAYSAVYVRAKGSADLSCYDDTYKNKIDALSKKIEEIADARCTVRYQEIQTEGSGKIRDAEAEILGGEQKLADAELKLTDAQEELEKAKQKLKDGKQELAEGEKKWEDGSRQLEEAKELLTEKETELAKAREAVEKEADSLEAAKTQLAEGNSRLSEAKIQLEAAKNNIKTGREKLEAGKAELEEKRAYLTAEGGDLSVLKEPEAELAAQEQKLDAAEEELIKNTAAYTEQYESLQAVRAQIDAGEKTLQAARAQIASGERQLEEGRTKTEKSEAELQTAAEELESARQQLADGRDEYQDGKQEYEAARAEYEKESGTARQDIETAKNKVNDAKKDLEELKQPEWFVLDRESIQTYVELDNDAQRIGAIGEVFPAIFFLVAALVSLTTMTRMVEEGRIQIGTMKALGYSKASIAAKYIWYALAASLSGSIAGIAVGSRVLPDVIISAYAIMYVNLPKAMTPVNWTLSALSVLIAVFCTVLAAMLSCYKELSATPAELMRPAAPKQGQRVILERANFIWKRLNFSKKSTVRNLVRYKKRFFMTVFGIGGCMALLMVGFGLRDSIAEIVKNQYRTLWTYNAYLSVGEDMTGQEQDTLMDKVLSGQTKVGQAIYARQNAIDIEANGVTKSVYLFVPQSLEQLDDFLVLKDRITDERYHIPEEGVILSEKAARLLDVKAGDSILLKASDTERYTVTVTEITENYLYHYVYMSSSYYEKVFGEETKYNQLYLKLGELTDAERSELASELLKEKNVDSWMYVKDLEVKVQDMMDSLDMVVWVLILAAGLLAFVVLYNLNNISIIERRRELATIKVLGFYDREVAEYVYRENIALTAFGVLAGIVMGLILHQFVIRTSEVDIIMFGRNIKGMSYMFSILLTVVFAMIVNFSMYFTLKKIDMVESLKSVE